MKTSPGVLDFNSQRDASALSSFNPSLVFSCTNINPVMSEEIIIIIVIMKENPSCSHAHLSSTCRPSITRLYSKKFQRFFAGTAINRFVHVQCSCPLSIWQKTHRKLGKRWKWKFLMLSFCIGHNWNRKYFSRKDFYFCHFYPAWRWLPPDPWLGCVFQSTMPFGFFWSFSFLLLHVSATGENCRERYFHYALHVWGKQTKRIIKRGFSPLVVCFFFDNNSLK